MARFNEDQAALIDLAKQAQRTGLSPAQADVMRQWAQEHGLLFRGPEVHPGRPFGQFPHVHIGPIDHIPVKP
jgi:molybdopterin biosynthesis enzyme